MNMTCLTATVSQQSSQVATIYAVTTPGDDGSFELRTPAAYIRLSPEMARGLRDAIDQYAKALPEPHRAEYGTQPDSAPQPAQPRTEINNTAASTERQWSPVQQAPASAFGFTRP